MAAENDLAAHHAQVKKIIVTVAGRTAYQILNTKRAVLNQIETETGITIVIHGNPDLTSDQIECACEDSRGRSVHAIPGMPTKSSR